MDFSLHLTSQASPLMWYYSETSHISGFTFDVILLWDISHLRLHLWCDITLRHLTSQASPLMWYCSETSHISGFTFDVILLWDISHLRLHLWCDITLRHLTSRASPLMWYCSEKSILAKQIKECMCICNSGLIPPVYFIRWMKFPSVIYPPT